MNRREMLIQLRDFCMLYGIQGILSPQAFGASVAEKKRLVCFVLKYTGGATDKEGLGAWNFDNVLSPLKPYQNDIARQLGLSAEFNSPLNTHAAPQVSALTGAQTGRVRLPGAEAFTPTGNLINYSLGDGKSIDVLIGEKLQGIYKSQLPHMSISHWTNSSDVASTHISSSWGSKGVHLPTFATPNNLSAELKNRINCNGVAPDQALISNYKRKLAALELVKNNQTIFESKYIIDKDKFTNLQDKVQASSAKFAAALEKDATALKIPSICGNFPTYERLPEDYRDPVNMTKKFEVYFDLAVAALESNVTRSITINMHNWNAHSFSHYVTDGKFDQYRFNKYLDVCRLYQTLIGNFIEKLKNAGLYDDTVIFCNAGSCSTNQLHNSENLATYVVNGDKNGVVGSANDRKPIGSLLLDILHKFGITYSEYGGRDHLFGVGKKGNFI